LPKQNWCNRQNIFFNKGERDSHLVLTFGPVILSGRDIDGGGVELAVDGILIPFGGPGIQIAATLHRSTNLDTVPERGGHIFHNEEEIDGRGEVSAVEDDVGHNGVDVAACVSADAAVLATSDSHINLQLRQAWWVRKEGRGGEWMTNELTSKGAPKSEETTIEFSGSLTRAGNETDPL
jgi:hypothetical protein